MAVIVLDRAGLARSPRPLGRQRRGAFVASCAQRLASCFLRSPNVQRERPNHVELAQRVLTELWTAATTDTTDGLGPLIGPLERMPELTAHEQGRGAYQTHALAAMLYAVHTWEEESPNYVLQCAQCTFDTAAFLDRRLDPTVVDPVTAIRALVEDDVTVPDPPSGPFQPRELQRQEEDLAAISAAPQEAWEAVVAGMQALRSPTPESSSRPSSRPSPDRPRRQGRGQADAGGHSPALRAGPGRAGRPSWRR